MPSDQIWTKWFEASFPSNPWRENQNGSVTAHTMGREGSLPIRTQIQSLRMLGPLNGAPNKPVSGHPLCYFIPHSGCSGWL
jgi:hypothetical protein